MNIQGGGISFEVSGTNDKLMKILEQSKKAISTFSAEGVRAGGDIDKGLEQAANAIQTAFSKVDAVIDENLQAIKELEAENEKLTAQYAKAFMGGDDKTAASLKAQVEENKRIIRARQQIIDQAKPIIQELTEEEKKLQEQKKAVDGIIDATKSLKAQLRECKEQLAIMEVNGQRGTEAYKRMQQEAGRLANALGDAQTQAKILSHDNQLLQGTMSAISGITGGFTAAQGAVALFAGENENLQRVMLKVQSLMSITMGLQQVMNMLNKDSAFRLTIVARAKDMLTAANARLATALGISTAAAKALMTALTLGLSAAITTIVVLLSRMSSESKKAAEAQEAFNKKAAEAAVKPLSAYMELKTEWNNLTNSLKEREKWVQDNAEKFESLGFKVRNAKEAEELLVKNTSKFVEACMLKAKALAAQQIASEKYKEILEEQLKLEGMEKYETKTGLHKNEATGKVEYGVYKEVTAEWQKQQGVITKLEAGVRKYLDMQVRLSKEEKAVLASIGIQGTEVLEGSIAAAEKQLQKLQNDFKNATTDAQRADLAKKIAAQQKEIERMSNRKGSGSGEKKDPFLEKLKEYKEAFAKYSKWVQSEDATVRAAAPEVFAKYLKEGTSYLDFLEKQRATISGKAKKTAADIKQLAILNGEIADITKQTVLSDFEAQLNRELQMCNTLGQQLTLIARKREELANDNSELDRGKADILKNAEEDTTKKVNQETAALLQEYASYTNERIKFEESYARNRELLLRTIHAKEIDGEDAFIAELLKAKAAYAAYAREITSDDATIAASAKQRYAQLLKGGSTYLELLQNKIRELEDKQIKVGLDVEGTEQLEKLRKLLTAENTTDEQVQAAIQALSAMEKKARQYAKSSGSAFYDELLEQYKTYQQQTTDIQEKYAEQRAEAEKHGNSQMIAEINAKEQAELSKLAASRLMASESWNQLFSDLSTLSTKTINKLMADINAKKVTLSAEFNPADLKAINDQLEKAKNELHKRNPFLALRDSLAELRESMKADKLLSSDDPFVKQLQEKKKQYEDYAQAVSSRDEILARASKAAFSELLKDGSSYIDYINGKIAQLENKRLTIGLSIDEENALGTLQEELSRVQNDAVAFAEGLNRRIAELQQKKVTIGLDVEESAALEQLQTELEGIGDLGEVTGEKWKEAFGDLLKEGSSFVEMLQRKIAELQQKKVTIGLDVEGEEQLAALQAILKKEQGETKNVGTSLKETFSSVSSSIELIGGAFDSVVGGMKKMGIAMDEETEHILGDISGMISGAGQVASGIATGNPLSIIQGSVGFLSSAFDMFNSRDRKAEKSIKEHEKAVTRLGRAYNQLKHEVDKALGETVYQNQNSMIANLKKQQAETLAMIENEKSKKKTDWDRIEEWKEQIAEASRQIEDIIDDITKSITQTSAGNLANQLADALVEAFESGEEAADAFGKVANDVLKNAVKNALKLQFLETPLQEAIKQLQKDMGFDKEGKGTFNGLSATEQARFKDAVAKAGAQFGEAMKVYQDLFDQLDENDPSTLSGAIKGASQESIDLLAGQANAVRVNQVTSLDILRNQLARLSNIDANVGVIAGRLLTIINKLTTPADDGLRGQGITD